MADLNARDTKLIQYLNEAYGTEKQLETALEAHIGMAEKDAYRKRLKEHLRETKAHAKAVERRINELGDDVGKNVVVKAAELARDAVGQALVLTKGPIDMVRGTGVNEKLVKNAKDECATEALEIATYDALHTLAEAVGDEKTARLADRHRGQEERMLEQLRKHVVALTHATVLAQATGQPTYDASTTGAADAAKRFARNAKGGAGA